MGRPVFMSDNLFNGRTYPSHTLAASSTAADTSILMLSSGRRVRGLSGWSAATPNVEATLRVTCNRPRAADLLFLDRDHNLDLAATPQLGVRVSDDGFVTQSTLGTFDVPGAPIPMSHLFDDGLIRTHEGALVLWLGDAGLNPEVAWEYEVFIPAMGVGIRPELAGLMLGKTWITEDQQNQPMALGAGMKELVYTERVSPQAQAAAGEIGSRHTGEIHYQCASMEEYLEGVYSIDDLYADRKAMVIIQDHERAEEAILSVAPPGTMGFVFESDWAFPQVRIPFRESEPELLV